MCLDNLGIIGLKSLSLSEESKYEQKPVHSQLILA